MSGLSATELDPGRWIICRSAAIVTGRNLEGPHDQRVPALFPRMFPSMAEVDTEDGLDEQHTAELPARAGKVQQRTSCGCWRTLQGLVDFAVVESYLSTTTAERGLDTLDALECLFTTGPWIPTPSLQSEIRSLNLNSHVSGVSLELFRPEFPSVFLLSRAARLLYSG